MKAMILAAGRGNRLRPLTDKTPKPLLQVGQWTLIERLLLQLKNNNIEDIVINVAYLGEQIVQRLGTGERYGVRITFSVEGENGLETGGGILKALPLLGSAPFIVVSGDISTDYPFERLKEKQLTGLAHLVLVDNFDLNPDGDFGLVGNQLTLDSNAKLTFGNIGLYHPKLFASCTPGFFPLAPLLKEAIAQGQVTGEYFQGQWHNIGTLAALMQLRDKMSYYDS